MSSYLGQLMMEPINSEIGTYGDLFLCVLFLPSSSTVILTFIILDATQFVLLFFSVFIGAMVVTFNTRVLGGQISYLQSVAILGYCLFPLFIAALVVQVMRFVQFFNRWVRLACILAATLWCILCIVFVYISIKSVCSSKCSIRQKICCSLPNLCILYFLGGSSYVHVISIVFNFKQMSFL